MATYPAGTPTTKSGASFPPGSGGGGGSAPPVVATTAAGLGSGTADGALGIIRLGTWPDIHEERFTWRAADSRWVGDEQVVLTQNDRWSLDLGNYAESALTAWNWFSNPNPNSGNTYVRLNGSHNFGSAAFLGGTGVINVTTQVNFDTAPFTATGFVRCRDNRIAYTGKTASTFTGCTLNFGSGSTATTGADVVQEAVGGFGTVSTPIMFASAMVGAGFTLQERMVALMNASPQTGSSPGIRLEAAPYWVQYNNSDGFVPITNPPTGGIGLGAILTSTTDIGLAKPSERPFTWVENAWSNFAAGTITKRYLVPRLYGRMQASATDTGQVLDATLRVRWTT